MYMPAFGLVALPILVQIITIWFSIFLKKPAAQLETKEKQVEDVSFKFKEIISIFESNNRRFFHKRVRSFWLKH